MPDSVHISPEARISHTQAESVIVQPSFIARNWWLLRQAFIAAYEDNCFGIAKGAAYSFFLSLFPILTTMTALLIQIQAQSVVDVIAGVVTQVAPPGTEYLILSRLHQPTAKAISLPVVAILVALWAGSGAMMSLMEGFQAAYRIPAGRPFLQQRAMAVFLVIIAALPAVAASSLIIFGQHGEAALAHWLGVFREGRGMGAPLAILWHIARIALAFCTTTFVMGLLYFFGPNYRPIPKKLASSARSRFMRVWPGAFVATVLWLVSTVAFAWYVGHIANYNFFYGSMGAVIILLVWLYLIACIALIGCEFNAERERLDSMPFAD